MFLFCEDKYLFLCMLKQDLHNVVEAQRTFFRTGATLDVKWRKARLRMLRDALIARREELSEALAVDLGKSEAEAYLCDIGPSILEINEMLSGLSRWARPERHFSGLLCFPSIFTKVYKLPYGVTLIISPFNFPVLLTIGVLAASIAGGNTAVIKASSKSGACTAALKKMLSETFPPEFVTLVDGGHDVADMCLEERFDKIFYTGSPAVARHVMAKAAVNLTPVALELGGETGNWCIVRKDADLKDAARKIAFIKLCNAGQICININQVAVAEEVADEFVELLKSEFCRQIGQDALANPAYPKLIDRKSFDKCVKLVNEYADKVVFGGKGDPDTNRFGPTIIYPLTTGDAIVNSEHFSPLLPVVPFRDAEIEQLLETIESREHPLALYLFTSDIRWARKVMRTQQFGGGCINEVCIHLMVKGVPFNGTGHSGMGAYHGEWGFREFTHPQTVLEGHAHFNLSLREHPYTDLKLKLLRLFEK